MCPVEVLDFVFSTRKHTQLLKIFFIYSFYYFFWEGGEVNFEKDWIMKSFSKATITIYELLCFSLQIIINVFLIVIILYPVK